MTCSKSLEASAVINVAFTTSLAVAFSFAETINALAISMPIKDLKSEERVIVKRPEPQ